jgi:hypothetical protein
LFSGPFEVAALEIQAEAAADRERYTAGVEFAEEVQEVCE